LFNSSWKPEFFTCFTNLTKEITMSENSLYQRLGGYDAIAAVCADVVAFIESTRNEMVEA
jgi:hypothetical protein